MTYPRVITLPATPGASMALSWDAEAMTLRAQIHRPPPPREKDLRSDIERRIGLRDESGTVHVGSAVFETDAGGRVVTFEIRARPDLWRSADLDLPEAAPGDFALAVAFDENGIHTLDGELALRADRDASVGSVSFGAPGRATRWLLVAADLAVGFDDEGCLAELRMHHLPW